MDMDQNSEQKPPGDGNTVDRGAVEAQLGNVPMKPDINGFREGERVKLRREFRGNTVRCEPGDEGTVLVTNISEAHVRIGRQLDLVEVFMDGGGLIMTNGKDLEKTAGMSEVIYSDDGQTVRVRLH
jgi:hypothetical protein